MTHDETPRITMQELYDRNPWVRKTTKARKSHRCDICQETIDAGSHYFSETLYPGYNNDNDEIFNYHAHCDCAVLFNEYGDELDWKFPYDWEYWLETLEYHHVEYPAHWREKGET